MATVPAAPSRRAWLTATAADFARTSVGFVPCVLLLRAYERVLAGAAQPLPHASLADWARTLGSDLALAGWVAAVLAMPVLVLARCSPTAARIAHRAALMVVALVAVALAQYYATTLVPLGADLFGYSLADLRETVGASQGVSLGAITAFVVAAVLAWVVPSLARRLAWSRAATAVVGIAIAASVAAPSLLVPPSASFASETAYFAAVNKTGWFGRRSMQYLGSQWRTARAAAALRGYPMMHAVRYPDVLGPHLALGNETPNIVLVIVEGLGRDFTGPNAEYGGFTPFLDSLADRSLSWDNFLSTSGRTFGILPSLLGSLPFGETGFMELGARMPAHASLVTLLQRDGYATNYFTGTNGHFDRIDAFMERQGVDRFVDAAGFGPEYEREPASQGGESWGYPDGALFTRSLELLATAPPAPRLDIYLTISTHEPFIPPRTARYQARFEQRLTELPLTDAQRTTLRAYRGVFASLLYTDDALREFFAAYAARADFARTLFIVTGDHRLIPVPPANRLSRYHVPLMIYSPMLRAPRHIAAVSSHFDVLPSLLAMLHAAYALPVPDSAPWIGRGLDTVRTFRHAHALPLMRTKNELDEYLDGTLYLSGGRLYRVDSTLALTALGDGDARAELVGALDRWRAENHYVTSRDRLAPATGLGVVAAPDPAALAREDSAFGALARDARTPEQVLARATGLAAARDYEAVRLITRRLLRDAPSYHDARVLLGRTYSWEGRFDDARAILDDLVRRAPAYADGFAARAELEVFRGNGTGALSMVNRALAEFPRDASLLYVRARALELLGAKGEALAVLDTLRRIAPKNADADTLRARLLRR